MTIGTGDRLYPSFNSDELLKKTMFYLYILKSNKNGRYYVGSTSDLDKRLKKHNAGLVPSTKTMIPWVIVYIESYPTNSEARKREAYIKRQKSRAYIESLFNKPQS